MKIVEQFISVDVETAGPSPGRHALLSIGACDVFEPASRFYMELKPDKDAARPEALQISGLDMDKLKQHGKPPKDAMQQFADWVSSITPANRKPVFVAFNAPFDWLFVADYFHRYLGHNPFGHSALDMKAFFMGLTGAAWSDTGFAKVTDHFGIHHPLTHNALQDAVDQAALFRKMLEEAKKNI